MKYLLFLALASTITTHAQQSLSETWSNACLTAHNQSKIAVLYQLTKGIRSPDELKQHYRIDLTAQQKAFIAQSIGIFGPCREDYTRKYHTFRHIKPKYLKEKRAYKQARCIQRLLGESGIPEISLDNTTL